MNITKFGHCCLLIEEGDLRILTDPARYSPRAKDLENIDVILITDEHSDHLHVETLQKVLKNNPGAKIFTNHGVGKILTKEGIEWELCVHGQKTEVNGVLIEAFGEKHADIYRSVPRVDTTGYFIANRFFYPGDALTNPGKPVEILALPVLGPWIKVSEFMEYALEIHPRVCFPVHDGGMTHIGSAHRVPANELPKLGIQFIIPEEGKEMGF